MCDRIVHEALRRGNTTACRRRESIPVSAGRCRSVGSLPARGRPPVRMGPDRVDRQPQRGFQHAAMADLITEGARLTRHQLRRRGRCSIACAIGRRENLRTRCHIGVRAADEGKAVGAKARQHGVPVARYDLPGEQLADDQSEGCAAVAESNMEACNGFDGAEHRLSVARDRFWANAVAGEFKLRSAFQHCARLGKQPMHCLVTNGIAAVGVGDDFLLGPG